MDYKIETLAKRQAAANDLYAAALMSSLFIQSIENYVPEKMKQAFELLKEHNALVLDKVKE